MSAHVTLEEAIRAVLRELHAGLLISPRLRAARDQAEVARRILVVGAGKATAAMAQAVEAEWQGLPIEGCIAVKDGHALPLRRIECLEASHPIPDLRSLESGRRMVELSQSAGEDDLVVGLISGGASSLMESLKPGYQLEDLLSLTRSRLRDGSSIQQLNEARKSLSALKGGGLAREAHPARCLVFVLSDVIGNPLETIGSGPFLEADPSRASVEHMVIGDCDLALDRMIHGLQAAGCTPGAVWHRFEGDMDQLCGWFEQVAHTLRPGEAAVLSGEPTLAVPGEGTGGRCQEAAMRVAESIRNRPDLVFAAFGTDGTDGPTDAAGAIVDGQSFENATQAGAIYEACLVNSDSHRWCRAAGELLTTGPTHTNLNDLYIMVRA